MYVCKNKTKIADKTEKASCKALKKEIHYVIIVETYLLKKYQSMEVFYQWKNFYKGRTSTFPLSVIL